MPGDIRLQLGFRTHPKTIKLERRLGAAGVLSFVWLMMYCAENRHDGKLSGMDVEDIEIAAGWNGAEGVFVSTLMEVGFLDADDEAMAIHDWHQHQPFVAAFKARSKQAKMAAKKRWEKQGVNAERMLTGMRSVNDRNAPSPSPIPFPIPIPKEKTPPTPPKKAGRCGVLTATQQPRFDAFWSVCPKKVGKGAAEKAFKAIDPDAELLGVMVAAMKTQAASPDWQKDGGKYIPHPSTWLNQRRWEDEPISLVHQPAHSKPNSLMNYSPGSEASDDA